ncbi:polysaccharide pyruvyl transferase family protein [Rahnella perminowiae]|uniref:polysaccharide pyruvyl transferase family protein n=1 Tax=Rahnella perminowiae TaxID=2816244 RepID=UPI003652289D
MKNENLTFLNLLKFYHSEYRLVYKANPGNAGDGVIAAATYDFFEQSSMNYEQFRFGKFYSSTKDVLIFGGGGNLIEGLYAEGRDFLRDNIRNFSKIIIMPSTIKGYDEFFIENKDSLIICAREEITYNYLLGLGYVKDKNLILAHDMAFYLDTLKYTSDISAFKGEVKCFRTDDESYDKAWKENNHDISLTWNGDYWDNIHLARSSTKCLVSFLQEYSIINTDRLHIAILGSLLQKEVNFYPNSYYKNQAVYNHSVINNYPKTYFISSL